MILTIILILFLIALTYFIIDKLKIRPRDKRFLNRLNIYHYFFYLVYCLYTLNNDTDTTHYYNTVALSLSNSFMSFFGIGTQFMFFIGYPFIKWFGMSYYSIMALFSWFGFIGFLFFFLAINSLLPSRNIRILKIDAVYLVFLFPNMHFWTSYFGKDTLLFLGLGIFFWGIANLKKNVLYIALSLLLIFFVRPHIVFAILISSVFIVIFLKSKITTAQRVIIGLVLVVSIALSINKVFEYTKVDINDPVESFNNSAMNRSERLSSKSGSGVALSSYSLPLQVFTFLYRPLFIDSPGVLGLLSSFENFIILILTIKVLFSKRRRFIFKSHNMQLYFAVFYFSITTLMLSSSLSNLGIIIRQKNMVIIFLLTMILYSLSVEQKIKEIKRAKLRASLTPNIT